MAAVVAAKSDVRCDRLTDTPMTDRNEMLFSRTAENGLRPGEPAIDMIGGSKVVVTEYLGELQSLDQAKRELVENAHGSQHVPLDDETEIVEVVYQSVQSKPSKTYAFPVTRLARPWIEHAADFSASQHAEIEFAAQLLAMHDHPDAFDSRLLILLDQIMSDAALEAAEATAVMYEVEADGE